LASSLKESSLACDEGSLRVCLEACGKAEQYICEDNLERDSLVEAGVIVHLQSLIDNKIPSIVKHKQHVKKLCLDVDSARNR